METHARAPDPLSKDGDIASNWQNWKEDFIIFLKVTGYNNKSNIIRVNLLKELIGKVGIEAIQNISFDNIQDKNNIDILIKKLEEYFNPSKKEVVERYKFFTTRTKKQNESIEQYISILKEKAKTCNYNDMTDSLIRDKIVLNTHDKILRNKFFDADHLDLPKLGAIYNDYNINTEKTEQGTKANETKDERKHCWRCHVRHPQGKCPASGSKCRKCGKMNHFTHCCRRPRPKNNKRNNQAYSTGKTMNSMNEMTSFPDIPTTLQDIAISNDSTFDFLIVNTHNTNSKLYDDNATNHSVHLPKNYSHSHTEEVKPDRIITDLYNIGENIQPKQTTNLSNISTTPCDSANSTVDNNSTFDSVKINTHNTKSKVYNNNTTNHSAYLPKSTRYSHSYTKEVKPNGIITDLHNIGENIQPKQMTSFSDISTTPSDSANSTVGNNSTFDSVKINTHNTRSKLYDDNTTNYSAHLPKSTHYSHSNTKEVKPNGIITDLYNIGENIQSKQTINFSDISTTPSDSANSTVGNNSTFDSVKINTRNTRSKLYDDNTTNYSAHLPKNTRYSHSYTKEVKPNGIITDLHNIGENIQPKQMTSFSDISITPSDSANSTVGNNSTFDSVKINTHNTRSKLYDDNTTNHSAYLPKSTRYSHSYTKEVKPNGIITDLHNIGENIQPKQMTSFSDISTTPSDSANSTVGNNSTFDSVKINTHNTRSKLYDDNTTNYSAHLPKSTHYSHSNTKEVKPNGIITDLYNIGENIQPKQTTNLSNISTTSCDSANSTVGNNFTFDSVKINTHNTRSKLYDDNTTNYSAHLPKNTRYSHSYTKEVKPNGIITDLHNIGENIQPKQMTSFSDISTTPSDSANSTVGNNSTFDSVKINTHNTRSKLYDDNTTNYSAHLPKSTHYSHSNTKEVKPNGIITDLYNIGENIQSKQTINFSDISTTPSDSANSTVGNNSTFDSVKINTRNTRSKLYDDNTTNYSAHLPKNTRYSHSYTKEVKPNGIITDLHNIGENIQPKQMTSFSDISITPSDSANSTVGNNSTFDSVKINTHNTRSKLYDDNTTNHSAYLPKSTRYSHSYTKEVKPNGIITDLHNIGENIQPKQMTSFSDISTTPSDSANSTVGNNSTFDSVKINTHNTRSKLYDDNTTNYSAHLPKSTHYSHSNTKEVKPNGIITDLYNIGENIQPKQTTNLSNISTTSCDSANSTVGNNFTFDSVKINTHNTRSKLYDDNTTNYSAHLPKNTRYSHSYTKEVKPNGIITDLHNIGENIQPKQMTSFSDISITPSDSANSTVGNNSTFDSVKINTHNTRSKLYDDNTTNYSTHLPKSTHYSHSYTKEVKPNGIITDLYNIGENIQPKQTTNLSNISTTSCDSANSTVGNNSIFDSVKINTHNTRSKLYDDNTTKHSAYLPKSTQYNRSFTKKVELDTSDSIYVIESDIINLYKRDENIRPKQTTSFSDISTTPCDSANSTIGNDSTFNSVIANTHNTSSKLDHDNNTTNHSTHLPTTQYSRSFTEEVELDTSDSIYLIESDFIDSCKKDENIQPKQTKTARAGISQMPNRFLKWLRSKIHCKQCGR